MQQWEPGPGQQSRQAQQRGVPPQPLTPAHLHAQLCPGGKPLPLQQLPKQLPVLERQQGLGEAGLRWCRMWQGCVGYAQAQAAWKMQFYSCLLVPAWQRLQSTALWPAGIHPAQQHLWQGSARAASQKEQQGRHSRQCCTQGNASLPWLAACCCSHYSRHSCLWLACIS